MDYSTFRELCDSFSPSARIFSWVYTPDMPIFSKMGRVFVLTCPSMHESAERLGFPTFDNQLEGFPADYDNDVVIRWGLAANQRDVQGLKKEFKNIINRGKFVALSVNKLDSLREMSHVVLTPTLYEQRVPWGVKAVIRPFKHHGGQNVEIVTGPYTIPAEHYGLEWIEAQKEFRVWHCNGKTVMAERTTNNPDRLNEEHPVRSQWPYRHMEQVPVELHEQVIRAAKQLNIEFGAMDIISKNGRYYFLENNTSPCINDSKKIRTFFQTEIRNLIKIKFPSMRFDLSIKDPVQAPEMPRVEQVRQTPREEYNPYLTSPAIW